MGQHELNLAYKLVRYINMGCICQLSSAGVAC